MGVDPLGLCAESFMGRFKTNYNNTLNNLYGQDLELADDLGMWGATAFAVNTALSGYQALTDSLAVNQIANSKIQGALEGGDILSRLNAANEGARTAARTTALRNGMQVTGAVSSVIGAGATGYSVGARLNAAVRAGVASF